MKTTFLASIVLLSGTIAMGSQGGSANIGRGDDAIDACSLLTQADVEAAIGASVAEQAPDTGKLGEVPFSHCTYMIKNDAELVAVLLTVSTYRSEAEVKAFFENAMKEVEKETTQVKGVGDGAYWWMDEATLFVRKDEHLISVFLGPSVDGSLKAAQDMAEKALHRIGGMASD
jgi:hypothetical protein